MEKSDYEKWCEDFARRIKGAKDMPEGKRMALRAELEAKVMMQTYSKILKPAKKPDAK